MSRFPMQDAAAMNAVYGDPDKNDDGSADSSWEAANLVAIIPPYRLNQAWGDKRPLKTLRVHKLLAADLKAIFREILAFYGSQEAIDRARMNLCGGVYNFRLKRGGSTLSIHSWGCAIDLDPERNGFGVTFKNNGKMMPLDVVRIFEDHGWTWGGPWKDAMHFQAADIRGQKRHTIPGKVYDQKALAKPAALAELPPIGPQIDEPAAVVEPIAAVPADVEDQVPHGVKDDPLIKAVQEALKGFGFHEVGDIDGDWGSKTRGAIAGYKNDRRLPGVALITQALLDDMQRAAAENWKRPISEKRLNTTPEQAAVKIEAVNDTKAVEKQGGFAAVVAFVGSIFTGIVSQFSDVWNSEIVSTIREVASENLGLILAGVGVYAAWMTWQANKGKWSIVQAIRDNRVN